MNSRTRNDPRQKGRLCYAPGGNLVNTLIPHGSIQYVQPDTGENTVQHERGNQFAAPPLCLDEAGNQAREDTDAGPGKDREGRMNNR